MSHVIVFEYSQDCLGSDIITRFLSVVEPGVVTGTVFPLTMGKRKTGSEDVSEM